MTEPETDRQKEIETLLAERRKFEAWLAQLDAKRDSAASHVFERVHADYTKRLESVRSRLQDEAGTLRTMVADLEARLAKEQDRVAKKTDERAEAELRAMVGEYSEKEWNTTRGKLDSAISDLRAKFDGTERELAELKELLSSVVSAPAPARPSMMVAAAETVAEALHEFATPAPETVEKAAPREEAPAPKAEAPVAEVSEPSVAPAPQEPRAPTPFDELAFLRSVAGTPSRSSGNAAVPKDPAAEPPVKAPRAAKAAPPAPEPATVAAAEPEPQVMAEAEPVPAAVEEAPSPARTSAKMEEPAPLGGPTPRTSQAIRSLKCQECGTLNFPTEWYCERCGGELAAF